MRIRGILPPFVITRGRVMRKFLLATAALIALAGPAIAADVRAPVYKAPPPVVPAWSWTGCFAGGHAGSLWTKQDWTNLTPGGDFFAAWLGGHQANSWLGGVQAGCDYQFSGGFVIGIQGDYAWTDAPGGHDSTREIGVAYHSKGEVAGVGHRPCRLRLGSLPRLCQGRRCLAAQRLLGLDHQPRDRLCRDRNARGMDCRPRRRIRLHQCALRLR